MRRRHGPTGEGTSIAYQLRSPVREGHGGRRYSDRQEFMPLLTFPDPGDD